MVSSDQAAGRLDDFRCSLLIVPEDVTKALGINALAETYRVHQVAKHHAKLPMLSEAFRR